MRADGSRAPLTDASNAWATARCDGENAGFAAHWGCHDREERKTVEAVLPRTTGEPTSRRKPVCGRQDQRARLARMDQLTAVVELVDRVLGDAVVGAYLHGSAVSGGLRPASDVDVLVVSRRGLDEGERGALVEGLLGVSGLSAEARPVELTVVVRSEVRPWRYPPTADFQYGEWLRAEYRAGLVPRPEPMPDLALLLTMVLTGNRPLLGPPPARVLDPVPHADLVRASVAGVPALLDELEDDTRNVVLTLARVWTTLATGETRPKDAAADWALAHLPPEHRPVLQHARHLYLDSLYSEESWDETLRARVRPYADHVRAEIERLAGRR